MNVLYAGKVIASTKPVFVHLVSRDTNGPNLMFSLYFCFFTYIPQAQKMKTMKFCHGKLS